MKPPFLVFSGGLTLVGLIILWLRNNNRRDAKAMAATETSTAASVARAAPGTLVEVKGQIRCDAPVLSEYSGTPSVYFRSLLERDVEYEETGSDGKRQTRTRKDTLHRNVGHATFFVEDESGRVLVHPHQADIDAVMVHEEFQVPAHLASHLVNLLSSRQERLTYREYALAATGPVYVLGTVQPDRSIGPPPPQTPDEKKVFVISHRSEEQMARASVRDQMLMLLAAGAVFALALWMLWYGLR